MKLTPAVNFINVIPARFSNESAFLVPKFCKKVLCPALKFFGAKKVRENF